MLRLTWPRAVRVALQAVLVVVAAVIAFYFLSHRRPPTVPPAKVAAIPAEQVEQQEGIEHTDFRGERTVQVKAGSWRRGDDGLFYLEKNVEVRDLAAKGGREIFLAGDKIVYDKDWSEARLEGRARVRVEDLQFESSDFAYNKADDVVSTEHGVVISSPKLNGTASRLTYSFKDQVIRLEGSVSLRGRRPAGEAGMFTIGGEVLTYRRLERKGLAEGEAGFSLEDSAGLAAALDFRMTDDEEYLLDFSMRGAARISLVEDHEQAGGGRVFRRTQEIAAEELAGRTFLNMNRLHALEARRSCSLDAFSADGRPVRVDSGEMLFVFDKWGGLREYRAVGRAQLVEHGPDRRVARTISGESLLIEGPGEMLRVAAPAGGEARLDSADSEITAQVIELFPGSQDVFAADGVKLLLKAREEAGGSAVGFFSGRQPVMAVAGRLSYQREPDRLTLSEGARMWQEKQMLSGNELSAERATGELRGAGRVQAVFPRASKKEGEKEERLEVGGEELAFSPRQHLLTYRGRCWLKTRNASLTSDRIDVLLSGEDNELTTIKAVGHVVIASGFREGRGENAIYDLNQETIDLTGNPSLADKEKGVIEGDKLTFYLGDGRVHVENSGRERSVTVIKS